MNLTSPTAGRKTRAPAVRTCRQPVHRQADLPTRRLTDTPLYEEWPSGAVRGVGQWRRMFFGLLLFAWLTGAGTVLGAQRFPPPEFESGYVLPTTEEAAGRALGLQYADVAVLLGALGLATFLALRRRSRRGLIGLSLFSLVYFGFYREGCICAIGSVQNVALALFRAEYALPLTVLVFFVGPLAVALFFGRVFCAAVCPHGAIQDLVLVKPLKVPRWLEQGLGVVPFVYLGLAVLFAATGSAFIICRWDPFVPVFRLSGPFTMIAVGIGFLVLAMFVGRPYCRFLCPYGALLKLASAVSRWRVRITPDVCTQCRLCEESCPFGVIREPVAPQLRPAELARERWRFIGLLALLPVLVIGGGWIGSGFGRAASVWDADVALADFHLRETRGPGHQNLSTVETLALSRAERTREELLSAAVTTRHQFGIGGWLLGGWIGLVIGAKLLGVSVFARRTDYEPDPGACFACGRCFRYCPQERLRLGLPVQGQEE